MSRLEHFPGACPERDEIRKMVETGTRGIPSAVVVHVQNCEKCRAWYEHYDALKSSAK